MLCTVLTSLSLVVYSVFKLKLKYKEGVMVQRFVVVFNHHYLGGGPMEDDKE